MPIKLNSSTLNNGGTAKFNNTSLSQIKYNNTVVWNSETQLFPPGLSWAIKGAATDSSVSSTQLIAYCNGTSQTNGRCVSTTTINASNYSKLTFTVTSVTKNGNAGAWVGTSTSSNGSATNSSMSSSTTVSTTGNITVDISSLTGNQYVQVAVWGSTGSGRCIVTKVVAS